LIVETLECSLNSITVRDADLWGVVALAQQHGFGGVSLWRDLLDGVALTRAAARIAEAGLRVTSVCRGGMFPQPDEAARRARRNDNLLAVDQAHAIGAECLVVVCGPTGCDPAGARSQIRDGIADLIPYARQAEVRLAIEPFHPMMAATRSAITSLVEANDLVDALGDAIVGIAVDSYHVWWDATLDEEIRRAGSRLYSVQIADWMSPVTNELSCRGMPGEGCIDLTGFLGACRRAGYRGLIEVEVLSERWWAQPVAAVAEAAAAGVRRL
jgi:sugar phosphate isomerase/epimerase